MILNIGQTSLKVYSLASGLMLILGIILLWFILLILYYIKLVILIQMKIIITYCNSFFFIITVILISIFLSSLGLFLTHLIHSFPPQIFNLLSLFTLFLFHWITNQFFINYLLWTCYIRRYKTRTLYTDIWYTLSCWYHSLSYLTSLIFLTLLWTPTKTHLWTFTLIHTLKPKFFSCIVLTKVNFFLLLLSLISYQIYFLF